MGKRSRGVFVANTIVLMMLAAFLFLRILFDRCLPLISFSHSLNSFKKRGLGGAVQIVNLVEVERKNAGYTSFLFRKRFSFFFSPLCITPRSALSRYVRSGSCRLFAVSEAFFFNSTSGGEKRLGQVASASMHASISGGAIGRPQAFGPPDEL